MTDQPKSIATPDISHLTSEDLEKVYEPAEDSFLLLDALEADQDQLKSLSPVVCLEVGCGSGICITFLAKIIGRNDAVYWCTDINNSAATVAMRTGQQNDVEIMPIVTDLVGCLHQRLSHQVDVLLFNPPYVVTPSEEVGSKGLEAAWAGGKDGRQVIDRFLPQVPDLLSEKGVFYMVVIQENKPEEIAKILGKYGYKMETLITRRTGPELLSILKFSK